MGSTLIEKILAAHSGRDRVTPGDVIELNIDARIARDFGGANVVGNLQQAGLGIADAERTFFTFDCNPGGSDQGYAANQQHCRLFAAEHGISVFDIDRGVGTHIAIEQGLIGPGGTLVSTDSHANIMGAIGAFGQGMGDADIAAAFAFGRVWFRVPPTVKIQVDGEPSPGTTAKDLTLALVGQLGANGLLGCAAELYGPAIDALDLTGRITVASMATEMGGIAVLIPPNEKVKTYCRQRSRVPFGPTVADPDALYLRTVHLDVEGLDALVARPGRPDDVLPTSELPPVRVDSVFIGSCTNGRLEDFRAAADVLDGWQVAPGIVLKVVPASDAVWRSALSEGLWKRLKAAGALIGNAGCAGCAQGQIGQNGPGEITVSTGNRNFPGKQGRGEVYLASPRTAAASAVAGVICSAEQLVAGTVPERPQVRARPTPVVRPVQRSNSARPNLLEGRARIIDIDNIDTDMIYHNRYLAETDPAKMGQHTFDNLPEWKDFPATVRTGDVLFVGANFGAGSSRQHAVACFKSLGVGAIIARSFGAIYERNAINDALPILCCNWATGDISEGDKVRIDLTSGVIENLSHPGQIKGQPFSSVQLEIYRRGGLLRVQSWG